MGPGVFPVNDPATATQFWESSLLGQPQYSSGAYGRGSERGVMSSFGLFSTDFSRKRKFCSEILSKPPIYLPSW